MFDIGFWELSLVGLVSLLVLGPERLPKAARLAGFWIGKTRRALASVKQEIKEELQAEEFRQALKEHSPEAEIRSLLNDTSKTVKSLADSGNDLEQSLSSDSLDENSPTTRKPNGE